MVAIAYIYFLSLLNVAIRADLVARGRESDLGANISMVETIGKRDERQAIIMAKWLFGFDFRGASPVFPIGGSSFVEVGGQFMWIN